VARDEIRNTELITQAIHRWKPYPAYKPSGIEWLGEIPERFEVKRLKHLARCLDGRRIPLNSEQRGLMPGEYPYWGANGIVDHLNDWIFDEDLILLGEDGAPFFERSKDVAFLVTGKIWVNNHIHVLQSYRGIEPRYLVHMLNITDYSSFIEGTTRDKLTQDKMHNIPVLTPSLPEQHAIAAFLDRETGKIDALIEKKERQIELLQEKRAALISHAVTKGLNPNVPMKPSGIEWLGEIPEHWELTRLGWITTDINDINHEMPPSAPEGIPFLSAKDLLDDGTLNFKKDVKLISEEDFKRLSQKILPKRDDIIYSRIGACLGKARLVETDERFLISYSCCVVRLDKRYARPRFFRHLLDAEMVLTEARIRTQGIGVPDLGLGEICRFPVPLPSTDEQEAISDFLDERIGKLRRLITTIENSIDQLREYRTALISAAVTGKIDVREENEQ